LYNFGLPAHHRQASWNYEAFQPMERTAYGVFRKDRPRPAMSMDRIEADIAVMNGRGLETAAEPDTPGFDIRFALETGYTALDWVAFSGSTSNAASMEGTRK
jgi:hypothetical protein